MRKCSKVCWELLDLTEKQEEIIKRLTLKIKELESLLGSTGLEQYSCNLGAEQSAPFCREVIHCTKREF